MKRTRYALSPDAWSPYCNKIGMNKIYCGMKKHIAILFLLVCACAFVAVGSGCSSALIDRWSDRISDYRPVLLEGGADGFSVTVMSGVREDPYSADGVCRDGRTDYTVVTLTGYASGEESVPVAFASESGDIEMSLFPHPFDDGYSAEAPVRLDDGITSLEMTVGDTVLTVTGAPPTADGEYALTLASETVDPEGEILLRLTRNTVTEGGGRYWYVSFTTEERSASVLINAESGEVSAVRGGE